MIKLPLIESAIQELIAGKLPDKNLVFEIINEIKYILSLEENVLDIQSPVYVIGDIHGQFYDLLAILEKIDKNSTIVFLGDYVDRGYNSVEVVLLCFMLKIVSENESSNLKRIILLRGNHETRAQTSVYGFLQECSEKYDMVIYWKFCEAFDLLPIGASINKTYFCLHGGIIKDLTIEELQNTNRMYDHSAVGDILWSDPSEEIDFFEDNPRGAGSLFGKKALEIFLKQCNHKYLVRSHQLVYEGYKESLGGQCITIWGAPNYTYKAGNKAAVLFINEDTHSYIIFEAVSVQYKHL